MELDQSTRQLIKLAYMNFSIPKLAVFTTEDGIKQIKNNLSKITDWKDIEELIPKDFFINKKLKRSGIAGIFSASLELTKQGITNLMQKKFFEKVLIKKIN